jgi:hypothetical protein
VHEPQSWIPPQPSGTAPHFPWQAQALTEGVQQAPPWHTCPVVQSCLSSSLAPHESYQYASPPSHPAAAWGAARHCPDAHSDLQPVQLPQSSVRSFVQLSLPSVLPHVELIRRQKSNFGSEVQPHSFGTPPPEQNSGGTHSMSSQHLPL